MVKILGKNKPFMLSPLANITIPPFRRICSELGADITVSEMTFARGLIYKDPKSVKRTLRAETEKCYGIQLLTNDTSDFSQACEIIEDEKLADFIDLNLGCPKAKIVNANLGSSLLKKENFKLLSEMIKLVNDNFTIPLSLKIRLGFHEETYLDILRLAEEFNVSFVTLHARLAIDTYEERVKRDRWSLAKETFPDLAIIANGDISTRDEGFEVIDTFGVDGVAIGRAARGFPHVFSNTSENISISTLYLRLIKYMQQSDYYHPLFVKTHSSDFVRRFKYATKFRKKIFSMSDLDEIVQLTREFLEKQNE
ncbi:MAG: tRNA dihydrouridine synthase [Candidatus Hodarchaeales archaeon]